MNMTMVRPASHARACSTGTTAPPLDTWREPAGRRTDHYRVWLSKIMLQQTTVDCRRLLRRFVERWPTSRR